MPLAAGLLQFPTITICNNFTPDKWAFLRNLMNLIKFECNHHEECEVTQEARDFFRLSYLLSNSRNVISDSKKSNNGQKRKSQETEMVGSQNLSGFPIEITTSWTDTIFQNIRKINEDSVTFTRLRTHDILNIAKILQDRFNGSSKQEEKLLEDLVTLKLNGRLNNHGMMKMLNITKQQQQNERNSKDQRVSKQIALAAIAFAMPTPGRLGTFYTNFKEEYDGEASNPYPLWFYPYNSKKLREYKDIDQWLFFARVATNITGDSSFFINPADIASILDPVPDYKSKRKYSRQFRSTLALRTSVIQPNYTHTSDGILQHPKLLAEKNHFGQLLGKNLLFTLEVMYHSMLRTNPMRRKWFKDIPELYQNLEAALIYPSDTDLGNPMFNLEMNHYQSENGSQPYMLTQNVVDEERKKVFFNFDTNQCNMTLLKIMISTDDVSVSFSSVGQHPGQHDFS